MPAFVSKVYVLGKSQEPYSQECTTSLVQPEKDILGRLQGPANLL